MRRTRLWLVRCGIVVIAIVMSQLAPARAQQGSSDQLGALKWRHIGPVGNRVAAVAGVPGNPNVYYAGAASGGLWKTVDGGLYWEPIFDGQTAQSIGAIAIAPSDPNVVWVGTGEQWIRSHISIGDGVYKSTDAGRTWTKSGLEKSGRFSRLIIHPQNPDIVLACTIGTAYGPQPERGVFRTTDGGRNWERVLFVDENTGCADVAMDPTNPRIVFAGMWQFEIKTWGRFSGGPGSGLYRSTDGGTTWTKITGNGLPAHQVGKFGLAIARTDPNRIYALIETSEGIPWKGDEPDRGKLWRSDDGGRTWQLTNYDRNLGGRTHYYFRMAVSPDNENETYYLNAAYSVSLDGGKTSTVQQGKSNPGGDNHDIWIDPTDGDRMAVANDGGVAISINRGKTWNRIQLPIAQMYHVTVDNDVPYHVLGNRQDGPSFRGPSDSKLPGLFGFNFGIPRSMWHTVGGGESGFATPDPFDANVVWSTASGTGSVGGIVARYDVKSGLARNVEIWPDSTVGYPAADLKYRFNWTMPFVVSRYDRNTLYAGSQFVHMSTDGGNSWKTISPDLTTNDKTKQQISGGLTPDNIGVEYFPVVMAITESPKEKGLLWAGTNDGQVQVTRDGGKSWTNVTKNIPGLPEWGTVYNIEASRFNPAVAYAVFDFHQVNNRDPFAYKTNDYGKTWKAIVNGIPKSMLSYVHCIKEDPVRQGLLYLGTENAIYLSFDDGEHWEPLQTNLPHAPVYWITAQEHFNDLVVATYGRGFWILDDLAPIQQLNQRVRDSNVFLFTPRAAYRYRAPEIPGFPGIDPTTGDNPTYGASISYWLKAAATGDVKIQVLDAANQVVRTMDGTKNAGVNRVYWDLRYDQPKPVKLRTPPLYAPEVTLGADGTRPAPDVNGFSVLAPPGAYTVKLTAAGQTLTQPVTVRKDPASPANDADVKTQTTTLREIQGDYEAAGSMVNTIELIRSQLMNLVRITADSRDAATVKQAADTLEKKLLDVEDRLIQRRLTGQGQDVTRWPSMLLSKIEYLAGDISSSDDLPTSQAKEVHGDLKKQIASLQQQLSGILEKDLTEFNRSLRDRGIQNVIGKLP